MNYAIVTDGIIENIIVAEPDMAVQLGALPTYDGCIIGQAYTAPVPIPPGPTPEDIILDTLADHEYRLCLTELGIN